MSVRYWSLFSDELMQGELRWPDGLRPVRQGEAESSIVCDSHWWLLEDDGAPATLEGKRVELTFTRSGDKAMIGSRNPAT